MNENSWGFTWINEDLHGFKKICTIHKYLWGFTRICGDLWEILGIHKDSQGFSMIYGVPGIHRDLWVCWICQDKFAWIHDEDLQQFRKICEDLQELMSIYRDSWEFTIFENSWEFMRICGIHEDLWRFTNVSRKMQMDLQTVLFCEYPCKICIVT